MNITYPCLSFPVFRIHIVAWGKALFFRFPVFLRMHIVAVGAKGALAGWTGSSVALPKVAADDIPVLPEGAFRLQFQSHAPKVSKGRAESPLVCPQTQVCPTHLQGKVGEGIANPFPKGALLAPRASGKPLLAPAGAKSPARANGAESKEEFYAG